LCALKSGIGSINSGGKLYKISEIQVFAGAAFYLYLPENILLSVCNFLPNYCFFVWSLHLFVEVGYRCSLSVASNVFVITNLTFTCKRKIMHPYECGILGVKALDFYPLFGCGGYSHCSCCCGCFCGSTGINCCRHTWAASDRLERQLRSPTNNFAPTIKQAIGYPSRAVASAIEENFVAATDAGFSCIHRCFGDRRLLVEFAQFKQLVSSPATTGKGGIKLTISNKSFLS